MATKKKELFTMKELGTTADKKTSMYNGCVGGFDIGTVVAPNKSAAKKKLLAIARRLLK